MVGPGPLHVTQALVRPRIFKCALQYTRSVRVSAREGLVERSEKKGGGAVVKVLGVRLEPIRYDDLQLTSLNLLGDAEPPGESVGSRVGVVRIRDANNVEPTLHVCLARPLAPSQEVAPRDEAGCWKWNQQESTSEQKDSPHAGAMNLPMRTRSVFIVSPV